MKTIYLILILTLLGGCKKDTANTPDDLSLKGEWEQQTFEEGLHEGSLHNFIFKCDNFTLKISSNTDAIGPNDSCSNSKWNEYVTGSYKLENDNLILDGYYTDSLYQKKTSGCYNIGAYSKNYPITYKKDTLYLDPNNSNMYLRIKLFKVGEYNCTGDN
ncbi:MAG: hypothetical protein ACI9XP_001498 [Lentimonas sp.]|jgi:hypothetical protein